MMKQDMILSLRNLSKSFGKVQPADNFSIDIKRGEFFSMLGSSGSGKSTILRMIAGLERPDSGEIRINDEDVTNVSPWERHLGMVFQNYAIFPHMNVAQNVGYGLRRTKLSASDFDSRVSELLELVGLEGFGGRRISQLSGGEQQRVAIARALAPKPDILLLDEPLSALDEKIRREMQTELRAIQRYTKTTFIYVTHDQEEALTMSDRIAVLNQGKYVQCGEPEAIFRAPATPFVAQFFRGANLLDAEAQSNDGETVKIIIAGQTLNIPNHGRSGNAGKVSIRGETIGVGDDAEGKDLILETTVLTSTYRGLYTSIELKLTDGQILAATYNGAIPMAVNSKTKIGIRAEDIVLLEAD